MKVTGGVFRGFFIFLRIFVVKDFYLIFSLEFIVYCFMLGFKGVWFLRVRKSWILFFGSFVVVWFIFYAIKVILDLIVLGFSNFG